MYIFKSHGSTERVHSSSNPKNPVNAEAKFKKDFLKTKASNREITNRSAMNTKPDPNAITIPFGRSPDRSKNMSVYSQGPQHVSQSNSHAGSTNVIGASKSPYLGVSGGTSKKNQSQSQTSNMMQGRGSKKESLLANATYKS